MSEDKSLDENQKIRSIRIRGFENVLREQFQLAYFGKISYEATEQMIFQERRTMYKLLVEQKQLEKQQHEEAVKSARARQSMNNHRGRRR